MSTSVTEKRTTTTKTSSSGGYGGGGGGDSFEYSSSHGGGGGGGGGSRSTSSSYHSSIHPRSTNVQRSSFTPASSGGSSYVIRKEYSYGVGSAGGMSGGELPPGSYSKVTQHGVSNVKTSREKEKKDMQDLNERLGSYIEKVRFLEAQNKKLVSELDELRTKWGKETAMIKQMYETELKEARNLMDDTSKDKAELEIRVRSLEEINEDLRRQLEEAKRYRQIDQDQINKLNQQLSEADGEISMLRRMVESLEKERDRDKISITKMQEQIDKLRADLNNETLGRLDAENRRQTLEEEIEFLKELHDQEMKELAALAYRDTTQENREFWKSELSQAIRDIQTEYDAKVDQIRGDLEGYYNLKVQEFRTGASKQNMETTHAREEVKKLRNTITDLRSKVADLEARNAHLDKQYQDFMREFEQREQEHLIETTTLREEITNMRGEMERILQELQTLMDAKLSLELEIAAYRKLLECEENRVGLKTVVEQMINTRSSGGSQLEEIVTSSSYGESSESQMAMKMMRGEVSAKTTYQRTSKGAVAISEASPEGKFINLENNSTGTTRKDENMDGWQLRRKVDGKKDYIYTFRNFSLKSGKSVKIWSRSSASQAGLNDLVYRDEDSWGIGQQVTTNLLNEKGEERASHVQKTIYQ